MSYCVYCGNNIIGDDGPCPACQKIIQPDLVAAHNIWVRLSNKDGRCCGGLHHSKNHLYFHGKDWRSTYEGITVECGVCLYKNEARTYYLIDTRDSAFDRCYGSPVPFPASEKEWMTFYHDLHTQLNKAGEAAWNDDFCQCQHCGKHYHASDGGCADCTKEE